MTVLGWGQGRLSILKNESIVKSMRIIVFLIELIYFFIVVVNKFRTKEIIVVGSMF